MRKTLKNVSLVLLLVVLVASLSGCTGKSAVEATIKNFFSKLEAEDKVGIKALLDLASPDRSAIIAGLDNWFSSFEYNSLTYQIITVDVTGDVAIVSASSIEDVIYVGDGKSYTFNFSNKFTLYKRSGNWYIYAWSTTETN